MLFALPWQVYEPAYKLTGQLNIIVARLDKRGAANTPPHLAWLVTRMGNLFRDLRAAHSEVQQAASFNNPRHTRSKSRWHWRESKEQLSTAQQATSAWAAVSQLGEVEARIRPQLARLCRALLPVLPGMGCAQMGSLLSTLSTARSGRILSMRRVRARAFPSPSLTPESHTGATSWHMELELAVGQMLPILLQRARRVVAEELGAEGGPNWEAVMYVLLGLHHLGVGLEPSAQ